MAGLSGLEGSRAEPPEELGHVVDVELCYLTRPVTSVSRGLSYREGSCKSGIANISAKVHSYRSRVSPEIEKAADSDGLLVGSVYKL